jgi:N-methylhydantoinase B
VPHQGESALAVYTIEGIPKTMGILGGDPGSLCNSRLIRGTDIRERFAAGEIPQDLDALRGDEVELAGKGEAMAVSESDILYWNWLAPAGYGDPLTRSPALVAADLGTGAVSPWAAEHTYGVVIGKDGEADLAATEELRMRRFLERVRVGDSARETLAAFQVPPARADTVGEVYLIDRAGGCISCLRCRTKLAGLGKDPKQRMVRIERPIQSLGHPRPDPRQFVDDDVVWRDFCCPGCGVRLATEVSYPGEPSFAELEIR